MRKEDGDARAGSWRGSRARTKCGDIVRKGFDGENGEKHGVGVVNVEHEAGDHGENQPLCERARRACLVPIPKEKSDGESGMRMGPRGIEIHIDGQRAGPPDRERGDEGPAFFYIVASQAEGQKQAEKSVERGSQRHGDAVRSGKTVSGDGGTESARDKDA